MPYGNGQIIPAGSGLNGFTYLNISAGFLLNASIIMQPVNGSYLGPNYAQIFLTLSNANPTAPRLILASGYINNIQGLAFNGRIVIEEEMFLTFMDKTIGGAPYQYAYYLEKVCPGTITNDQPFGDTTKC